MPENNFSTDVEFLRKYVSPIVLSNGESKIVVVPQWQGRTMTSTSRGDAGTSYGYINHDHIASGKNDPQINLYGGEDRMWISPEGGQFSVFFDPDVEMSFANWRTPPVLDTAPFDVVSQSEHSIQFTQNTTLTNFSRFDFQLKMDRTVNLLSKEAAADKLGINLNQVDLVFHESQNTVTNIGDQPWRQETGLIGVWMLCMNKPADNATLIIPFNPGPVDELGTIVTADYFGKLDSDRLVVNEDANLIFLRGDGNLRSKLGLSFQRVTPRLGSWDQQRGVLSVIEFSLPQSAPDGYTNNLWEHQSAPFEGDVINCYNDGPNDSGGKLGGFFELETISPALALKPDESFTHRHSTIRMEGERAALNQVSEHVFGIGLDQIESQLGGI